MGVVPNKSKTPLNLILDVIMDDSSETKLSFSHVLETVSENDVERFKQLIELNPDLVNEIGLWYGRQAGTKGMVLDYRTPLMVAAMYASLDMMKLILSVSRLDVNAYCGADKMTALHFAAFSGSIDSVKLLLENGANVNVIDSKGNRPCDVISVSRNQPKIRAALEELLKSDVQKDLKVLVNGCKVASLTIPPVSDLEACESPLGSKFNEKKEYPVDPSLPDIKNIIYTTDEFRMYSFKVRPCSRAYSHDWTECPFVHPGENARRRDPRKFHYSCVPCPEFRKGSCRRGDMCEYAHGVFECWLHPAQYRTRLCKDGPGCNRRVCFFAHLAEELRPLYASTGSAVPSPRSMASAASVMDMAAALNIFPGSPNGSPSGNGSPGWQQQNIPTLLLPGSNFQGSRLQSSLNARDIHEPEVLSRSRGLTPSNLDEIFSDDMASPRYDTSSMFSPSHKSAVMNNHFQQQQSNLSPINTKPFSPKPVGDHSMMMSSPQSPVSARLAALALREKHNHMRSLSARDLSSSLPRELISENGGGSPMGGWSKWESSNGRPDWSVNGDDLNRLKRSYSNGLDGEELEPDFSWVQSLVKDSPPENKEGKSQSNVVSGSSQCGDDSKSNPKVEPIDHSSLGAWLDEIAAQ